MDGESCNGGILVRVPRAHSCSCPEIKRHEIHEGDVWTCGICGSVHVAKFDSGDIREPSGGCLVWNCTTRKLWTPPTNTGGPGMHDR